jgi:hypothetical protein
MPPDPGTRGYKHLKPFHEILVVSALGCASAVVPGTAHALTCATNWLQVPADGERDVPTNTRIWAYGRFGGASPARLVGPRGEVAVDERFMPVAIAPGQGTNYPVLVPRAELEPNTRYAIEITYDYEEPNEDVTERTWFTTGIGPATAAPPLPELLSIEGGAGDGFSGFGRWLSLGFALQGGILIADTADALGAVSSASDLFEGGASFDSLEITATTRAIRWLSTRDELSVGQGDCLIWPESAGDQQTARFGVLDRAGNLSGWMTTDLELPSPDEARAILAAEQDAEEARADEIARLRERKLHENDGLFANHNCSFAPAGKCDAGQLAGLTASIGALLLVLRRRRLAKS